MKTILVIGSTGQLGTSLLGVSGNNARLIGISHQDCDVSDIDTLSSIIHKYNPYVIINTTAYHNLQLCETSPKKAFQVNAIAVGELAKLCKANKINFITISTDYVFDGKKKTPYIESDVPNPIQVYGASKYTGELLSRYIYPGGTYVIRTCGLYGGLEGSHQKGGNFILNILKESKHKKIVYVNNSQRVNPTYAPHLATAIIKLINTRCDPEIYHLANENFCSWYEFSKYIFQIFNITTQLERSTLNFSQSEFTRPKFTVLKNTKGKKVHIVLPHWKIGLIEYKKYLETNNVQTH